MNGPHFAMSQFLTKEELYKAKSEYYEKQANAFEQKLLLLSVDARNEKLTDSDFRDAACSSTEDIFVEHADLSTQKAEIPGATKQFAEIECKGP